MQFQVDGEVYEMRHGTFRNKICSLKKKGEIELEYRSGIAFYTLKGHRFGKAVTLGIASGERLVTSPVRWKVPRES